MILMVLKELSEDYKKLSRNYSSINNETETSNQNHTENNNISDIKNTREIIKIRFNEAEDQINNLEDKIEINTNLEQQINKKWEGSSWTILKVTIST